MNELLIQQGHFDLTPEEMTKMFLDQSRQLDAARYYVHKMRVHQYAIATLNGEMTLDQAKEHYLEAMKNYDSIIALAPNGKAEEANAAELAKGSDAVGEAIEKFSHGR